MFERVEASPEESRVRLVSAKTGSWGILSGRVADVLILLSVAAEYSKQVGRWLNESVLIKSGV